MALRSVELGTGVVVELVGDDIVTKVGVCGWISGKFDRLGIYSDFVVMFW